jgi:urocanate hydratase
MVLARNTISGNIADVSPKMLEHPTFKDILEVVDVSAKPYIPEMYAPGTKSEKASKRDKKQETVQSFAEDVVEEIETITNTEEEN